MRFLVDECTGPRVAQWLRDQGHDVVSAYDEARGATDVDLLDRAFRETRVVVTNDKDFGERVFRDRLPHHGVILLRLTDFRGSSKISAIERVLAGYADRLEDRFTVVTDTSVRSIMPPAANIT